MTPPAAGRAAPRRRWLATEVVQTSAMDCGPAALTCVLTGFGIAASYGRLREACQTDVDGSSIDTLEQVAPQLGLAAEQVLIPPDHVGLDEAAALPAIAVLRLPDGPAHFVVLWRRLGRWLQVMDPATGRRWVHQDRLRPSLYAHSQAVPAAAWRDWAASADFCAPMRRRLIDLGLAVTAAQALLAQALAEPGWRGPAALDACTRLCCSLVASGGIARGAEAQALVQTLCARCWAAPADSLAGVPADCWSVVAEPGGPPPGEPLLRVRGAVLLRLLHRVPAQARAADDDQASASARSPELAAALREPARHPLAPVWRLLWQDGLLAPLTLAGAMVLAAAALVVETLLLRAAIDLSAQLGSAGQRLLALAALAVFVAVLLGLELPIVRESLRHGRQLEMRLRMAWLARLPLLPDRYFQSRSVGDMAERSHVLPLARQLPGLGLSLVQTSAELLFTLAGVALLAPASLPWALAIALAAAGLPWAAQPLLAERDLRVRSHSSALSAFCLDALRGVVPARTHGAEPALRRQHEALLVHWVRASRRLLRAGLAVDGLQALLCSGLTVALLAQHFGRAGAVAGADLLLVYWAIKLGAIGHSLAALALQYPAQRNLLMRLLEPLAAPLEPGQGAAAVAPEGPELARTVVAAGAAAAAPEAGAAADAGAETDAQAAALPHPAAVAVHIRQGQVVAGGHTLLQALDLRLAPGEHVAVVGPSGAGKSTLLGLLMGWHRLAQGSVQVDGQPLDAAALQVLRRHTAWVEPGVQLWNRSLIDNLTYASGEAGLPRLGAAVAAARLRSVLEKLPDGLQTRLGEGGALLSGGEGQRVRLARAFLQDGVRLALLDEPFRGLDRGQRAQLLAEARRWWRAATLLCVTHDVGETLGFDRVWVVDGGRIVEDGAPRLLAQGPSRYADLLRAEQRVHDELWQAGPWQHVHLHEGRVVTADEPGPAQPAATPQPLRPPQHPSQPQPRPMQALASMPEPLQEPPAPERPAAPRRPATASRPAP